MKVERLLAQNVRELLRRHGQKQADLAQWCRHSDPWVSDFLSGKRSWQLEDLDRIADFWGLQPYQLFIPGITAQTERRTGDRRQGRDRRLGQARVMLDIRARLPSRRDPTADDTTQDSAAAIHRVLQEATAKIERLVGRTPGEQTPAARASNAAPRPRPRKSRRSDPPQD